MQIYEFQDMMRQLYFHKDSKRGAKRTYEWLVDELEELAARSRFGGNHAVERVTLQNLPIFARITLSKPREDSR